MPTEPSGSCLPHNPDISHAEEMRRAGTIGALFTLISQAGKLPIVSGRELFNGVNLAASESGLTGFETEQEFRVFLAMLVENEIILEIRGKTLLADLCASYFSPRPWLTTFYKIAPAMHARASRRAMASRSPDIYPSLNEFNRLRLLCCGHCGAAFGVPLNVMIDLYHEGKPVFCPAGHPCNFGPESMDPKILTIFDC